MASWRASGVWSVWITIVAVPYELVGAAHGAEEGPVELLGRGHVAAPLTFAVLVGPRHQHVVEAIERRIIIVGVGAEQAVMRVVSEPLHEVALQIGFHGAVLGNVVRVEPEVVADGHEGLLPAMNGPSF